MSKPKKESKHKKFHLKSIWVWLFLVFVLVDTSIFTIYDLYFSGKIFPNTYVAGYLVGGLTKDKAVKILQENVIVPQKVILSYKNKNYSIETKAIDLSYDLNKSAQTAFDFDRTGNILFDFESRLKAITERRDIGLSLTLNEDRLASLTSGFAQNILTSPTYPSAKIINKQVVLDNGQEGLVLDSLLLRAEIGRNLSTLSSAPIEIPVIKVDPRLNVDSSNNLLSRSNKLLGKSLNLTFEFQNFQIIDNDLVSFLNPSGGYQENKILAKIDEIAGFVNREPQNGTFKFDGGKVTEFTPSVNGAKLNRDELKNQIETNITTLESSDQTRINIAIPTDETPPNTKLSDINDLGIRQLIGHGTSTFFHSIPTRVHNVGLASSKFNSVLVKPGDILSFDNIVGDVSSYTGYQQAYIIQDGKTVLGDGGGVCQVSTTLFRAALNAGLPIIERRAHAYRVGYYEQDSPPGIDATVFVPTTDLKILNDTPGYLLIQTAFDAKKYSLVFDIYGTSDGRVATISKPVVSNITPAPPDVYQDDPTLPAGTIKQVDFKANGARVTFNYTVTRNGQQIYDKTFISNYQPWQAVYLRGTGPIK